MRALHELQDLADEGVLHSAGSAKDREAVQARLDRDFETIARTTGQPVRMIDLK
ncbi:hypothetical protein [Streptomyces griseorubiginosus]|uniref:hypothetical protein n=1 Tax=Streptomyces griseorubiginosus TaxID=67304 RepID=UPI0036E270F1